VTHLSVVVHFGQQSRVFYNRNAFTVDGFFSPLREHVGSLVFATFLTLARNTVRGFSDFAFCHTTLSGWDMLGSLLIGFVFMRITSHFHSKMTLLGRKSGQNNCA
jgi:hypothetical protein